MARDFVAANPDKITVTGLLGSPATITLCAWFDVDSADTIGCEIVSAGDVVGARVDRPSIGKSGWYQYSGGYRQVEVAGNYAGTGWHHLAWVVNPGASFQGLYIDASEVGSATFSDAIVWTGLGSDTVYGAHGNGATSADLDGRLADVRIFNVALSLAEIDAVRRGAIIRPDACLVWSHLWGVSGPEPDWSGNARTGALTGTTQADHGPGIGFWWPRAQRVGVVPSVSLQPGNVAAALASDAGRNDRGVNVPTMVRLT